MAPFLQLLSLSRLLYTHYFTLWELQSTVTKRYYLCESHVSHDIIFFSVLLVFCSANNFPFSKFLGGERSCDLLGTQQGSACYSSSIWTSQSRKLWSSTQWPYALILFYVCSETSDHKASKTCNLWHAKRKFLNWKTKRVLWIVGNFLQNLSGVLGICSW